MDLQIDVELPTAPQPTYHLTIGEITTHYRDVMAVIESHGISHEQAAVAIGLSPTTLTAYGRGYGTAAHRTIPAATLDRIRDLAIDSYWTAAAWPYRCEIGGEERAHLMPVYTAHDDIGLVCGRHPHPLYMREVADKIGGHVQVTWAIHPSVSVPPLDAAAALRSRWRVGVWQLRGQFKLLGRDDADAVLCELADCCRYSLWTLSTEYRPWLTQVTTSQVERLEAAVDYIERGDEIQPWESAVAKAMANLEDF
ncbi:helix-turn-helix transcriptional regulator [Rhizobium sp. BK176]|uniref:helix-turn-helix domain-containing protein n=1 Tax=Rhizobium sp. BK176 TaxID=2587071 RepID=UPI0021673BC6|nr:helix-turn-helix transcriptional regulator [Rhizobium sp. BK176]MCS4092686.1 hypothetical protein [Rhizobium sp. BK176]